MSSINFFADLKIEVCTQYILKAQRKKTRKPPSTHTQ